MVSLTEVDGSEYNCIKGTNDQEELDYDENLPEDFDRVQIKPPDPEPLVLNGTADCASRSCELGEVNTDEDESPHEPNGVSDVTGNKKPDEDDLEDLEDGEVPESDEEGADEKSNGEVCSDSGQGKTRNIAKLYQKYLDEGDASDDAGLLEEGEDDSEFYGRSKVPCKYFLRGHCVHGQMCRYFHSTTGDSFSGDQYEFVPHQPNRDILELRSPIKDRRPPPPPPQYLSDFEEEMPEAEPQSFISKAWTSGLKDAREMIKRSKQKKETDIDFEQRKMLAGIESLDDSDFNLQVHHPIEEPPQPKKHEPSVSPPADILSNKGVSGSKSMTSPSVSKIAIPSSFGADQWQDPWQRSSAVDHTSHHISGGGKSRRHHHPGAGKDKGMDGRGIKGRKRSGSSSSDSSRSREGKRSRSSSSSSRSNSRSSRSRSRSPAKWKKNNDLKKSQQPSGKPPVDESFKPTVNEKKINVYDTKKKPVNGSAPKGTEESLNNSSSTSKPVVPDPPTSASGNHPALNQKTPLSSASLPDHLSHSISAVPNKTIAPPELRLQQKAASKTAEKQAKKPKRRSESSSSSGSSSNSSSSSDSESSSSDSGNEGDRVKNKKNSKESVGNKGTDFDTKTKHRKKHPSASQSTLKDSDAAKIIKSIADSDLKHWKEDPKKVETSVLSTPLLLSESRSSSNRNSASPTKGRSEKSSRNSRHASSRGGEEEKVRRKRSGSRSLSMSSISSASSEEASRGNHRKREKKKLKNISPDKLSLTGSKEAKKSKISLANTPAGSVSGSTSLSKKATSSSLKGSTSHSSSKTKNSGSSKHGSSGTAGSSSGGGGKSQSKTNRKQQLMAQLAEIEEKIARTRQKCSKEFK